MEVNEKVFEAITFEKFVAGKKRKVLFSGFLFLLALVYLGSAIYSGKAIGMIGGIIYTLLNGVLFMEYYRKKPVRINISEEKIFMQQGNLDLEVLWIAVTKAVFNGRYLDLYGQSSLRTTFDLQPFTEDQRTSILSEVALNLNKRDLEIRYLVKGEGSLSLKEEKLFNQN